MQIVDSRRAQAGGAAPILLILAAVAAVAVLFVLDPLGFMGSQQDDADPYEENAAMIDGTADAEAQPEEVSGVTLAGRYGSGDLGALTMQLVWVGSEDPVVGQPVLLRNRRGFEVGTETSDSTGRVTFGEVTPDRSYSLEISGEGFKAVSWMGIRVESGRTTDLGKRHLGENIVISGRVTDSNGRPVAGSEVVALSGGPDNSGDGMLFRVVRMGNPDQEQLDKAVSDESGYFTLSRLADGRYRLVARHGGYATDYEDDVVVQANRSAAELTLVLGKSVTLTGMVKNSDGIAVRGARVIAYLEEGGRRMMGGGSFKTESTVTDDNGRYVLDTLVPEARYRLGVMAEGYAPVFETNTVSVDQGRETRDFVIPRGGALEGVVTDSSTGEPIAGADVAFVAGTLWGGRGRGRGRGGEGEQASTQGSALHVVTNEEGRFRVENLVPGQVQMAQVDADGYVSQSFSGMWGNNAWPDIVEDETTEVEVMLEPGGIIKGRVMTTGNRPVPGAVVKLQSRMSFFMGAPDTVADEKGDFEIKGVRQGEYEVVAEAAGYASDPELKTNAEMTDAGGTVVVDVHLVAASLVTGVVKDAQGEPISGVRVRLERVQAGGGGRGGWNMNRFRDRMQLPIDMTDTEGRFRLPGVPADQWRVIGESSEFVESQSDNFRTEIGKTAEVELKMQAPGRIEGRVIGDGGRYLPGASVRIGSLDEGATTRRMSGWEADRMLEPGGQTTNDEGAFTFDRVAPGPVLIRVESDGYVTVYKRNLMVEPDGTLTVNIGLDRGHVISGTVRGADGQPIAGARIFLTKDVDPQMPWGRGADGEEQVEQEGEVEPRLNARTDEQGRYEITEVPGGTWNAYVGMAAGHVGYWVDGEGKSNAIIRGVRVPGNEVNFSLSAAPEGGDNPFAGMGGNRGGGGRGGGR